MSVNKIILVGRLCKDPEVRVMASGESVANATLATKLHCHANRIHHPLALP